MTTYDIQDCAIYFVEVISISIQTCKLLEYANNINLFSLVFIEIGHFPLRCGRGKTDDRLIC